MNQRTGANVIINKTGKSKQQLMNCLESLIGQFKGQIEDNDIKITRMDDGIKVDAQREVFFLKFWVKASIIAKDNAFDISWDTNAPESKVKESLGRIVTALENC